MSSRLRVAVVLAIVVILAGVAVPPVIEDHLEPGFCSADCPVQHAGHGAAIAAPPLASAARRAPVVAIAGAPPPRRILAPSPRPTHPALLPPPSPPRASSVAAPAHAGAPE